MNAEHKNVVCPQLFLKTNYLNYRKLVSTIFTLLGLAACGGGSSEGGGGGATTPAPATSQVSTLAGTAAGANGIGAMARFVDPVSSVSDDTNLYVLDGGKIRKIVIATGVVTTLAGKGGIGATDGPGAMASFYELSGITCDGSNLYVTDSGNNKIRKIVISTGVVTTLAGSGKYGAADGPGATASFSFPSGITSDGSNLYVADSNNNKIRKIVIATGEVSSVTGTANSAETPSALDGAAASATFYYPYGITSDGSNLYVQDSGNNKIRKIVIATGEVSSVTGTANSAATRGAADGAAAGATFNGLSGITSDGTNLYVADNGNNKIRKIVIATGEVSSFTGSTNTKETPGALDGAAANATFYYPYGIASDGSNLYVADRSNGTMRKIALSSTQVSTLAGTAYTADGTGAAANFHGPDEITSDGTNLYVADIYNHKIRKIVISTGVVTTLAGTGGIGATDGPGAAATFTYPQGITSDGSNLYVADTNNDKIRKIVIATGVVTTLAGNGWGATDGPGATATFKGPSGITSDGGNLYVTDMGNNKIRKIVIATGEVSSVTGTANSTSTMGAADGAAAGATFFTPRGITSDGTNLYVADESNHKIRKIVISTGEVSSVTGTANSAATPGALDGAAASATFYYPQRITSDGTNLYVTDIGNHKIRKIVIATGVVSSVTGPANRAATAGAADGANTAATFDAPSGIVSVGGSLYVTDYNNTIRKIQQ